jgi:hypothetical protein
VKGKKKKLGTTPKKPMIVLFRRCVGFGVRLAVWFRYSLNKQNGNNAGGRKGVE